MIEILPKFPLVMFQDIHITLNRQVVFSGEVGMIKTNYEDNKFCSNAEKLRKTVMILSEKQGYAALEFGLFPEGWSWVLGDNYYIMPQNPQTKYAFDISEAKSLIWSRNSS